jgi:two-component system, NarL family, nitrate/nitrite response regulator NarL
VVVPIQPSARIELMLIDDHALFREGLAGILEKQPDFVVVGNYAEAGKALEDMDKCHPSVILLDFDLGMERALDFIPAARRKGFEGQILVVTAGVGDQEAVQLIQAGVAGIVHKHNSPEVLCEAIRAAATGDTFLEKKYLTPLFHSANQTRKAGRPQLTERDKAVLRLVFQGLANKEIGTRLDIAEGAVKASLRQLFKKLSVQTRAQLVKVALENYRDQL